MAYGEQQTPRFYGRRKGRPLRAKRTEVMETLLPQVRIDLLEAPIDPATLFDHGPDAVWLEIGSGGGEHAAFRASTNPDVGLIAAEVFEAGVASLLKHMEEQQIANIRIWDEDVRRLLPSFADGSLDRVFLLFPDPWPKTRHAPRRFVNPENLAQLARVIKPGGELLVASDHPVYIRWTLRHLPVHPEFEWIVTGPADWAHPDGVPITRYEEKAHREGRVPHWFTFRRR